MRNCGIFHFMKFFLLAFLKWIPLFMKWKAESADSGNFLFFLLIKYQSLLHSKVKLKKIRAKFQRFIFATKIEINTHISKKYLKI